MGYKWHPIKMKKLICSLSVMLFIAIMITMISCNKTEKKIVGKWVVDYAKNDGESIGKIWTFKENGTFVGDILGLGKMECEYLYWKKNNTLSFSGGDLHVYEKYADGTFYEDILSFKFSNVSLYKNSLSLSGKAIWMTHDFDPYENVSIDTFDVYYQLRKK